MGEGEEGSKNVFPQVINQFSFDLFCFPKINLIAGCMHDYQLKGSVKRVDILV